MVTISNPSSASPTISYNKKGKNIQFITVTAGGAIQNIANVSERTICVITISGSVTNTDGVRLPSNADIGDEVFVFVRSSADFSVFAPSGENISGYSSVPLLSGNLSCHLVKVSSTDWVFTRSN